MATICHGPWVLISAGVVRGRTLTGSGGVRDDLIVYDAGWQDDAQTHELLLVINAAAQGETLDDVITAWRAAQCKGVILSKIDEAVKLAQAILKNGPLAVEAALDWVGMPPDQLIGVEPVRKRAVTASVGF